MAPSPSMKRGELSKYCRGFLVSRQLKSAHLASSFAIARRSSGQNASCNGTKRRSSAVAARCFILSLGSLVVTASSKRMILLLTLTNGDTSKGGVTSLKMTNCLLFMAEIKRHDQQAESRQYCVAGGIPMRLKCRVVDHCAAYHAPGGYQRAETQ